MLGTFAPQREPYVETLEEETTPSGVLARGIYLAKLKVCINKYTSAGTLLSLTPKRLLKSPNLVVHTLVTIIISSYEREVHLMHNGKK